MSENLNTSTEMKPVKPNNNKKFVIGGVVAALLIAAVAFFMLSTGTSSASIHKKLATEVFDATIDAIETTEYKPLDSTDKIVSTNGTFSFKTNLDVYNDYAFNYNVITDGVKNTSQLTFDFLERGISLIDFSAIQNDNTVTIASNAILMNPINVVLDEIDVSSTTTNTDTIVQFIEEVKKSYLSALDSATYTTTNDAEYTTFTNEVKTATAHTLVINPEFINAVIDALLNNEKFITLSSEIYSLTPEAIVENLESSKLDTTDATEVINFVVYMDGITLKALQFADAESVYFTIEDNTLYTPEGLGIKMTSEEDTTSFAFIDNYGSEIALISFTNSVVNENDVLSNTSIITMTMSGITAEIKSDITQQYVDTYEAITMEGAVDLENLSEFDQQMAIYNLYSSLMNSDFGPLLSYALYGY